MLNLINRLNFDPNHLQGNLLVVDIFVIHVVDVAVRVHRRQLVIHECLVWSGE